MISEEAVDAYNKRLTIDTSNYKKLTPSQRDAVKTYGSQAEALLKNRDLAMFIHHFKFEVKCVNKNTRDMIGGRSQKCLLLYVGCTHIKRCYYVLALQKSWVGFKIIRRNRSKKRKIIISKGGGGGGREKCNNKR